SAQSVLHVQRRLVLQAVVLRIKIASAGLVRRAVALVVVQLGEALFDRLALRNLFEIGERDLVLGLNPLADLLRLAHIIFEPAVRIEHLRAVKVIHLIDAPRFRIMDRLGGKRCGIQQANGSEYGNGKSHSQTPSGGGNCSETGYGDLVKLSAEFEAK